MSDTNVIDFAKYKKDPLTEQSVRVIDQVSDDVPEAFQLVDTIGTFLFDERDLLVSKDGPTLCIKWGDTEYGLTIRPLDSHYENLEVWKDHVTQKYQEYVDVAQPDDVIDLTIEEIMILSPEESNEGLNAETTESK